MFGEGRFEAVTTLRERLGGTSGGVEVPVKSEERGLGTLRGNWGDELDAAIDGGLGGG